MIRLEPKLRDSAESCCFGTYGADKGFVVGSRMMSLDFRSVAMIGRWAMAYCGAGAGRRSMELRRAQCL